MSLVSKYNFKVSRKTLANYNKTSPKLQEAFKTIFAESTMDLGIADAKTNAIKLFAWNDATNKEYWNDGVRNYVLSLVNNDFYFENGGWLFAKESETDAGDGAVTNTSTETSVTNPREKKDNTKKYLMWGGIAVGVILLGILIFKKKVE